MIRDDEIVVVEERSSCFNEICSRRVGNEQNNSNNNFEMSKSYDRVLLKVILLDHVSDLLSRVITRNEY